jgi:hypothetical protein
MTATAFAEIVSTTSLQGILGRYAQAMLTQIGQSAACNRVHGNTQRCARWLLQTHDRVHRDRFELPTSFLAQMLGVTTAMALQASDTLVATGAIQNHSDHVTIVDREKLERHTCECYHIIAREYGRLIDGDNVPSPLDGVSMSKEGRSTLTAPTD